MSLNYFLNCIECNREFNARPIYNCPVCNGILEVWYNYQEKSIKSGLKQEYIFHDEKTESLLGEGNTPLLQLGKTSARLGENNILGKCEFMNPTGSFKDRPVAAGIKKALDFGYKKVIVASSGNGAAAVAAYSAKFDLSSTILVPENTPDEKVKQSQFYGANIIKIKGPYSNSFELAQNYSEEGDVYNLTTTFINPYTLEGDKGVAYEIDQQSDKWPDYVIVPIGAGPLLVGVYKGFEELKRIHGKTDPIPKMVGIQAEGCSPIARAFERNEKHVISEPDPKTIAGGIGDGLRGYAKDGTFTLNTIRKSNGSCLSITDEEIMKAQENIAKDEGIFVEPSGAASLAGFEKFLKLENVKNASVILLLTGHGLKDMNNVKESFSIPIIEPTMEELNRLI
jgi:threonine synthase